MNHRTLSLCLVLLSFLAATAAFSAEGSPVITLERTVHFTAPDGSDVVASPGSYIVEASAGTQLKLVRTEREEVLHITAAETVHQEEVTAPIALVASEEEDVSHVVLLLPGGKGLDAAGSHSGVRSRGTPMVPLTSATLRKTLTQVRVAPPPAGPDLRASKIPVPPSKELNPAIIIPPAFSTSPPIPHPNMFFFTVQGSRQGKFRGELTRKGFEDKMQGLDLDYQVVSPRDAASGAATGKRQHRPIRLTKLQGAATPQLFTALVTNELLPAVVIDFFAAGIDGQMTLVQTIKLTNAFITELRQYTDSPASGLRSLEEVVFTFQTIETINHIGKTAVSDSLATP